jgi:hypothetical protein
MQITDVSEKLMRRIFGSKKMEVKGLCRKLHNENLHNLCSSPSVVMAIK